jgi:hypothetical protein
MGVPLHAQLVKAGHLVATAVICAAQPVFMQSMHGCVASGLMYCMQFEMLSGVPCVGALLAVAAGSAPGAPALADEGGDAGDPGELDATAAAADDAGEAAGGDDWHAAPSHVATTTKT